MTSSQDQIWACQDIFPTLSSLCTFKSIEPSIGDCSVTLSTLEPRTVKTATARESTNQWTAKTSKLSNWTFQFETNHFSLKGFTFTTTTTSSTAAGWSRRTSTATTRAPWWGIKETAGMMRSARRRRLTTGSWGARDQVKLPILRNSRKLFSLEDARWIKDSQVKLEKYIKEQDIIRTAKLLAEKRGIIKL